MTKVVVILIENANATIVIVTASIRRIIVMII